MHMNAVSSVKDVGEMKVYALAVLLALYSSCITGGHQNKHHHHGCMILVAIFNKNRAECPQ